MASNEQGRQSVEGLRVALVHWCLPPTTGGVESHLYDLARLLRAAGCQVTMITGEERPEPIAGVEMISTPLLNIDEIRRGLSADSGYTEQLSEFLGGALASRRIRLVHGHQLHHFAPQPAIALDRLRHRLGFRLHHTFHETWPDLLHHTPVYHDWDGNYAVSEYVRQECADRLGIQPVLLRLGVDTQRFVAESDSGTTVPRDRDTFTVLHPARLLPWKGVHVSVRAMGRLRDRGVPARLLVTDTARIADWNQEHDGYRAEVIALIRDLELEGKVEFTVARFAEMHLLYRRADVVIYPTVEPEPYGLVPLEAMSMTLPVVASRIGGITETIVDGVTGFLVPPGDDESLADHLALLHNQAGLRREMGAAGRARVIAGFDVSHYGSALLDHYASSLNWVLHHSGRLLRAIKATRTTAVPMSQGNGFRRM